MCGGKQKAIEMTRENWRKQDADSILMVQNLIGLPSNIIQFNGELQCSIPQSFEYRMGHKRVMVRACLIGISMDGGRRWYFIDAVRRSLSKMKESFPNLSDDLIIPEQEKPVLTTEE